MNFMHYKLIAPAQLSRPLLAIYPIDEGKEFYAIPVECVFAATLIYGDGDKQAGLVAFIIRDGEFEVCNWVHGCAGLVPADTNLGRISFDRIVRDKPKRDVFNVYTDFPVVNVTGPYDEKN